MTISYGKVTYTGRAWRIEGEPFMRARLKRVFPRVPQKAADHVELFASAENTRELQWFIQRYPMSVDRPELMEQLASQHVEAEVRLSEFMAGHVPAQPISLALPPREYQHFAAQLYALRHQVLLGDELGLGKTVSAIAGAVLFGKFPLLVVCPAHLPRQWQAMLQRFAPGLTTTILKSGKPYDLTPKRKNGAQAELLPVTMPDVIITSYHKARGWAETLAGVVKQVIFDECQQLRSPWTEIYSAAQLVAAAAEARLGLSATPIHGYGHEFFHVLNVIAPDALGEYDEFIREWCTPQGDGKARLNDSRQFGAYLRREGLMLRRTRKDVGRELPKLTKIVHDVDCDPKVLAALKGNAVELARTVLRNNEQFRGEKMRAAGEFDVLMRQATGIAKAPFVVEFVKMLLDDEEAHPNVVLFGWHRDVYSIWLEGLADFKPVLYTGTESATQKAAAVEAFVSGRSRLLIMSLRSGSGVDGLQAVCNTAVIGELDWSPAVLSQCIGRIDRDGQQHPCNAYYLVADDGADPIMAEVLGVKREQLEGVTDPDGALVERVDTGENSIQALARDFLVKRGEAIDTTPEATH